MKRTIALTLACASVILTWAVPARADPAYDQCIARTSTNAQWAACGTAYLKRLDDALNSAWKKAASSLQDERSRADLLREQRAWIKFRDESCKLYANGSFGREGQVVHFIECRASVIAARISGLNAIGSLTR